MFSVIIPLYNKAPYVAKAIESVLGQTYRDFEVIVIDDGSIDQSLEVAKTFENKSITIVSQPNSGVSTARNNGVKLAKYPYICFLDADDWWHPTFLEEIYGSGYYIVKNGQERIAPIGVPPGFERGIIDYCEVYAKTLCMPLTSISVAIPKHIFDEEEGFKSKLKLGEDFDLWIRIILKHKAILVNKPLAYYNQDVEVNNRAIGSRFYKPEEHMLFSNYGDFMHNEGFRFLFERLALYGLLSYYLNDVNKLEVYQILSEINWNKHEHKYLLYYKKFPRWAVKVWFRIIKKLSIIKNRIKI